MEFICRGTIVDGDDFVCPIFWGTLWTDRQFGRYGHFGLRGLDVLLVLSHVALGGLRKLWEVLGCVGVG